MRKLKFPARMWFGFNADGDRVTHGCETKQGAHSEMLFAYAAEVEKRSSVHSPQDSWNSYKAGWRVASRKLETS